MNINSVPILFNIIKSCHDGTRLYPSGNPIVSRQMKQFLENFHQFAEDDRIRISIWLDEMSINGHSLPPSYRQLPAVSWFMKHCDERHIHQIDFEKGLDEADLMALITFLIREPDEFSDARSAAALMEQRVAVTVNAEAPESQGQPTTQVAADPSAAAPAPADPFAAPAPPTPPPPVKGEAGARTVSHESARLLIGQEDRRALFETMIAYIAAKKLKKVADTLTLIRADLASADREEREVAYSSYHVVIKSLINANQGGSLQSIVPSLTADFNQCQETDLFAIHLETAVAMIHFFQSAGMTAAYLVAIDILANQNMLRSEEMRTLLDDRLCDLLDTAHLEKIILSERNDLEGLKNALFDTHAAGLLRPLLTTLYASENRLVRKRVLNSLQKIGPSIHPLLVEDLRRAIDERRPWFIKRNLLTLLAQKPPVALLPLLEELDREQDPRLKDLLARCILQMATPEAFGLGRRLLAEADTPALHKLLAYLASGGSAYAAEVLTIFRRAEDDRLRADAVTALARIPGDESAACLGEILGHAPALGKVKAVFRLQAARALIAISSPLALSLLLKYRRDPEKEIREVIREALFRVS